MSIFGYIYHVSLINLRLWYEGAQKYLEESVTGSKFGLWKTPQDSCIVEEIVGRDAGTGAGKSW